MHPEKKIKTLTTFHLKNKKVLVRVDYNVPMNNDGTIVDDSRITSSLSTIKYIIESGASCILISHLGRPGGRFISSLSLSPVAKHLSKLLGKDVALSPSEFGTTTKKLADRLRPGDVLLLENIRFHPGEENPEKYPDLINFLSDLADIYINDAFATLHRTHCSTTYLPKNYEIKGIGFLVEKEVLVLENLLNQAGDPFLRYHWRS